jgi:DNA-binding response OmpR family regulator
MKKILILEDDLRIAAALAIRLETAGYDVQTAPNGFQGLKLALVGKPDLIVMDIWMPIGVGFSVAQRLRALGLGGIPVIFITASKLKGLKETAVALGAVAFFEKPYDPQALLDEIAGHFKSNPPAPFEGTQPLEIIQSTNENPTHHRG